MAAEPAEEDINNFISFTGVARDQTINFLKVGISLQTTATALTDMTGSIQVHNLNLQKAINAYFENPDAIHQQPQNEWGALDTVSYTQNNQSVPTFNIENSDDVLGKGYSAPPSRPPSRMNTNELLSDVKNNGMGRPSSGADSSGQKLSAAQLEERELQQAVAMSLGQDITTHQESGVIATDDSHFGPANQEYYDENAWGMTLFNQNAREEIISPDPEDRQRGDNEPAFLRPSQDALFVGGFLTILHSIPIAREALLLRDKVLPDYGHDAQWWNGQPVKAPRIVSLDDPYAEYQDWEDVIHETQRLMAFLDSTKRAFGSTDALVSLKPIYHYDQEKGVERFLEGWQDAALNATPDNQLSMIFTSRAVRQPGSSEFDDSNSKEFFVLSALAPTTNGQTLYDILDEAIWQDAPAQELDDVWLDNVAEVLTIQLGNANNVPINVKIPSTFYPDRYMETSRGVIHEVRLKMLEVQQRILEIESVAALYRGSKLGNPIGMTNEELLEKAAEAATIALPRYLPEGTAEIDNTELANNGERVAKQLREIAAGLGKKLQKLEAQKQEARDSTRSYSKIMTEFPSSPGEPPHFPYTLRGVCTAPHVTYVLRRNSRSGSEDLIEMEEANTDEWQWWRISFSTDDAKTQQAAKAASSERKNTAPKNADIIGFTTTKVREIEVLKAARDSSNVLLVYANPNSISFQSDLMPPALQEFVNADNISFKAELDAANRVYHDEEMGEPGETVYEEWSDVNETLTANRSGNDASQVNVFDYEVNSFDDGASSRDQEMQEVGGKSLLSK
ncbi:Polyphosphate kinase [Talaromyces islandicus]|uniref:Polyphosphate kinase n=1 Tax=Talaromyces islandicus TaxID=28573 RepID=A0A0U1LW84_TALIS|nr:Polyphosphate kinase [Talaromyces islandicus]